MDGIQNLENTDDDVQVVESVNAPPSKSTPHPGTSTTSKSTKNARENDEEVSKGAKKPRSEVWNFFDKVGKVNGVEKCKCKHCHKLFTCKVESGTTHLRRHTDKCFKTPQYHDVSALLDNQATLLKKWKFDSKAYRDGLAKAIIKHDLPFNYAEYDGVNEVNKIINPEFKPVCRNTARTDCLKVYHSEKAKLKCLLASHNG
ncbi:zinc finger BED domain-containing protein RICESLEEPER 4-like [Salvia miltiorrhiza]|uniref:zinc finger BED domain-containing protein RICESLEEPER 4-like n=1 Tax=Salvia miltiorrhiza TaxID=226208 RepID=UPI0025ABCE3C|nr:zinc finger BED domain-containing protein RICESLEEPER 4-like [Salvia miltiorrhiza]